MVVRGLASRGYEDLAYEIAKNHHDNMVASFEATGSVWEHHAPDRKGEGRGRKDFVGWTGITPIAVLFEFIFGLRPEFTKNRLTWHIRGVEGFSVSRYPFGASGLLDLKLAPRSTVLEKPSVEISGNLDVDVELIWAGNSELIEVRSGNRKP
jgi:hypothetical protein